jgi:hypothetical protein
MALEEADYLPSLAKISTRFENAVSDSLHFQSLRRLKMATHPCVAGNADLINVSLGETKAANVRLDAVAADSGAFATCWC